MSSEIETATLSAEAGERGVPVDARCTECKRVAVKRAPGTVDEPALSFKHVCHDCQTCTWWNTLEVLDGLLGGDA